MTGTMVAMSARSTLLVVTLPAILLLFAAPALAQDSDVSESESVVQAPVPAVEAPEEAPAEESVEWSYRFLVPATMLIGTLAVVGTIVMYFVRVTKNRYRVVE